jgi:hypothetical protein
VGSATRQAELLGIAARWTLDCVGHATVTYRKTESNEDDSTLLEGLRTIWMPTGGLRLMASCAFARQPRPDLRRRFQVRGANGDRC